MTVIGFLIAVGLFLHVAKRLAHERQRFPEPAAGTDPAPAADDPHCGKWHAPWHHVHTETARERAEVRLRQLDGLAERERRRSERRARRRARAERQDGGGAATPPPADATTATEHLVARARRRASAEAAFYVHLLSYLGVMALLALINLLTTRYPWFLWPALGWGIGVFSNWMAVFGSRMLRERYVEPAMERELRRERVVAQTEKQATIDELSSTIAHEIRNPIAAAKSLVQQMGEDPQSVENVEYAKVALEELDRVERRVAHLLRFAKEEDYTFAPVSIAAVVDSALTLLRAKLDAAHVQVARNYIAGPTVLADADKLKQVFTNVIDNAIDALDGTTEARRLDLFVENGNGQATVRVRDNGCGISADKIDRIFNPFFTTKSHGTGLGMAISKKIVEAHEGTVGVTSEPGHGTEFRVTLPLPR